MTTKVAVLNEALTECDQPPVGSFEEVSTWAARVRGRYMPTVKRLLEGHPWNFASAREWLSLLAATPIGRDHAYNKPGACLRIIRINDTGDPDDDREPAYDDEAGQILTNLNPCCLFFVSADWMGKEGSWPEKFAHAVALDIASATYGAFGKNAGLRDRIDKRAEKAIGEARAWDAAQKPFKPNPRGTWARARAGNNRWQW